MSSVNDYDLEVIHDEDRLRSLLKVAIQSRFFRAIPERQGRVLRVAVNTQVAPWRVVSVFFDRGMRAKP